MNTAKNKLPDAGWNFENSYVRLNQHLFTELEPVKVRNPSIYYFNEKLAQELNLDFSKFSSEQLAALFSGNQLPEGAHPIAQAYAGHQFGHFTMLGDGRAILMGEHLDKTGKRWDIQFKGSGRTPYSRGGDGRATLKSMLREYLISEAIHYLGIPSSRSLAVCLTGEAVKREALHKGAVLCRVAKSHIRIGTIELIRNFLTTEDLSEYCTYLIKREYPDLSEAANPPLELLKKIMELQTDLIVNWMRVGFIHGVMNTDNTSLTAETIDYGPCAFMNAYNPNTVFSSIDRTGRYAFGNQARVIQWNIAALAGAMIPIVNDDEEKAIEKVKEVINSFSGMYEEKYYQMMAKKIGIANAGPNDKILINQLLKCMEENALDYTNTFRYLTYKQSIDDQLEIDEFKKWESIWQNRIKIEKRPYELMKATNPSVIPRNHLVEEVLDKAAFEGNPEPMKTFLETLKNPYKELPLDSRYGKAPAGGNGHYQTFCGT